MTTHKIDFKKKKNHTYKSTVILGEPKYAFNGASSLSDGAKMIKIQKSNVFFPTSILVR